MTQLNVFCVVMCLVMGHPYQFYVLIPLLSFWFIMVYVFMAVFPRISDDIVKGMLFFFINSSNVKDIDFFFLIRTEEIFNDSINHFCLFIHF